MKVRAGTAYGCAFVNSGCNWPEGGCSGNCTAQTRRVEPQVKPAEPDELPMQSHNEPMLPYGTWRSLAVILLAVWSLYAAVPYFLRWLS